MQPRICECADIPTRQPDPRDSMSEGTRRLPNPLCPVHAATDGLNPADYDADEVRDAFDLAYDYDLGEWVGADLINRWTGDRIDEVAA